MPLQIALFLSALAMVALGLFRWYFMPRRERWVVLLYGFLGLLLLAGAIHG